MPRKRKRTWPQRVFRYAVTAADVPQQMWDQARAMQRLWNDLTEDHRFVRDSINETTPEEERKSRWEMFNRWAAEQVESSGLNWECGPDVLDRFTKACIAAAKQPERGWPRFSSLKVSIPHRFTGGGASVDVLSSIRSKRVYFEESPSFQNRGRYAQDRRVIHGEFGLDNKERIAFTATVHAPIPPQAIVKSVRWVGREQKAFGWSWWLIVTVEEPPAEPRAMTGRRCAIDVGWRKRGDSIRFAYCIDSDGRKEELLLSLDMSNAKTRRWNKRLRPGQFPMPESHDDLRVIACDRSCRLNECKSDVAEVMPAPPGFDRCGRRGLIRLLHDESAPDSVKRRIQAWLDWDQPRFRIETYARRRFAERRKKLYEKIASMLARQYDEIVIEDALNIKKMIEARGESPALDAAKTYHQIAATAEFTEQISRACRKHGSVLTKKTAAGTTATCSVCGGTIEPDQNLELTCERGHKMDQDENAAMNLLSQTWGNSEQKSKLRTKRTSRGEKSNAT